MRRSGARVLPVRRRSARKRAALGRFVENDGRVLLPRTDDRVIEIAASQKAAIARPIPAGHGGGAGRKTAGREILEKKPRH